MPADLARARTGTWVLFALTGLVAATWAARIPDVQDRLHLSPAGVALVLAAVEGGALLGLPLGGRLVTRRGSRACLRGGAVVFAAGLGGIAAASSLPALVVAVAVWAAANSVVDVALNVQGGELERRSGRRLLSGLHAGHSLGLLVGAGVTALAAALQVGAPLQLLVTAGTGAAVAVAAALPLVREAPLHRRGRRVRPTRGVVLLGVVALCAFAVDGSATGWSAVHLRSQLHASSVLAATGYGAFAAALLVGRLLGDRLLEALGGVRLLTAAGAAAAAAVVLLVLAPGVSTAISGWALLGLAVGPVAPTVLGVAARAPGSAPAAAVATTTTIGYLGSFTVPPLIGLLAGSTGVSAALLLLLPAAVAIAVLARTALRATGVGDAT